MELNREQIIKALECWGSGSPCHEKCSILELEGAENCLRLTVKNALTLIKELTEDVERVTKQCGEIIVECDERDAERLMQVAELTEENERLKEFGTTKEIEKEIVRRETRADTVRKMQERLKEAPIKVGLPLFGLQTKDEIEVYANELILQMRDAIDQIAKEMLEGEEWNTK